MSELLENARRYAESFEKGHLKAQPAKRMAILTCMDARLNIYDLLGLVEGDAHVIRNAGGVVTEDALRSLVISQRLLGTKQIILIHHTDCGLLGLDEEAVKDQIFDETGSRPPFAFAAFDNLEEDVRRSITQLKASPFLLKNATIRGFVYEVESGQLRAVGR